VRAGRVPADCALSGNAVKDFFRQVWGFTRNGDLRKEPDSGTS
jgi:hypothetical protein